MCIYKKGFFEKWLSKLDGRSQVKVALMIKKVKAGDTSHCRQLSGKLWEMKCRTGERVIYGYDKKNSRLLIIGGCTKNNQKQAIKKAQKIWKSYNLDDSLQTSSFVKPAKLDSMG